MKVKSNYLAPELNAQNLIPESLILTSDTEVQTGFASDWTIGGEEELGL